MFKKDKRTSIEIWALNLDPEHQEVLVEFIRDNFDMKFENVEEDNWEHFRVRVTRKEKTRLLNIINAFDNYWYNVTRHGNLIELYN